MTDKLIIGGKGVCYRASERSSAISILFSDPMVLTEYLFSLIFMTYGRIFD